MATATAEGVGSFGNSKSKRGLARGSMQPCLQGYSWIYLSVLRFTQPFPAKVNGDLLATELVAHHLADCDARFCLVTKYI